MIWPLLRIKIQSRKNTKKLSKNNYFPKTLFWGKIKVLATIWHDLFLKYILSEHFGKIQHVLFVHEGKKTFKCEVCNNSCPGKSNLNQLAALVHEGNKPFEYKICNFSYSEKSNLIRTLHPFMKKINYIKNWFMGITRLEILKPP